VRLGYAVFDPADYRDQVRVDEKEIEGLYEKEKAIHRSEPMYRLNYLVVDEKSPVRDDQAYMELLKTKDLAAYAKSKGPGGRRSWSHERERGRGEVVPA